MAKFPFKVGDRVRPVQAWQGSLPSGVVCEVVLNATAIYIEGDKPGRAWSPHLYEIDDQWPL